MRNISMFIIWVLGVVFWRTSAVKVELPSSFIAADDGKWRKTVNGFSICAQVGRGSDNDSPFILEYQKVQPASEVHVKVSYMMVECSACTYVFDVSALRTNEQFKEGFPKFTDHAYTSVGKLLNRTIMKKGDNKRFTSVVTINTEDKMGVYLAFSANRTCGGISAIEIWYFSCQASAAQLLNFPEQPAPSSTRAVIRVQGRCIVNSIAVSSAEDNVMMCYANGTTKISGGCQCQPGYYMNGEHQCIDCLPKTFKPFAGNTPCFNCTKNVKDGLLPRMKLCECLNGHFRPLAFETDLKAECEAPPSNPRDLNMTTIKSQWAVIAWKPPKDMGTDGSVWYDIYCEQCDVHSQITAELSFTLTNLKTYSVYNITVYAMNNVTKAIGIRNSNKLYFRTLSGLPSSVANLKVIRNDDGSVTIKWDTPEAKGGPDLRYYIEVNGGSGFFSKNNNYSFAQEEKRKEYTVFIRSHTSAGFSKTETVTFSIDGKARGIPLNIAIGVGSAFGVILLIAVACIIIFYRRRHPSHLQTVRLENGQVKLPKFSGNRLYVEPTTYEDVTAAVIVFAKQLERSWIEFDDLIGSGEFGDVYKGTLQRPMEERSIVAVKTLKGNANKKASDDFLSEAAYMGQFDDLNVIALEGVVVRDKPVMIVIEYMSNGSLDKFLQENDSRLSPLQLLGMARGVSSGMTYLSEGGFIHRDLAARNILVTDNMVCKVADFGMSRELTEEDEYNTTGGKIPVRWTSPEAIQFKKFTSASDVWSYGILLWEIMSFGERPYWDWGNYEVVGRLESGYRLPPPMGCPKVVHDLMLICWQKDRVKRPKFREIRNTIDKWLRNPELLKQEASVITKRDENLDYAAMTTLKEWLDSIKMSQYLDNFTSKNLVTPRQILELSELELKELGVIAVGHRMKIMKSIKATKDQLFSNTDESNERLLPM